MDVLTRFLHFRLITTPKLFVPSQLEGLRATPLVRDPWNG